MHVQARLYRELVPRHGITAIAEREARPPASEDPRAGAQRKITDSPVRVGDVWRHRKGALYQLVGFAVDEATREPVVLYVPCASSDSESGSIPWARPLHVFLQRDGDGVHKFVLVERAAAARTPQGATP